MVRWCLVNVVGFVAFLASFILIPHLGTCPPLEESSTGGYLARLQPHRAHQRYQDAAVAGGDEQYAQLCQLSADILLRRCG